MDADIARQDAHFKSFFVEVSELLVADGFDGRRVDGFAPVSHGQCKCILGHHRLSSRCVCRHKHMFTTFQVQDRFLLEGIQFEGKFASHGTIDELFLEACLHVLHGFHHRILLLLLLRAWIGRRSGSVGLAAQLGQSEDVHRFVFHHLVQLVHILSTSSSSSFFFQHVCEDRIQRKMLRGHLFARADACRCACKGTKHDGSIAFMQRWDHSPLTKVTTRGNATESCTTQCNAMHCNTIMYSTTLCNAILLNTTTRNAMQ
mmetsp:Transcript_10387/g.63367  ORF Transcript_10387/g.63367 Transcript_10387/m.63367 type:complete len:259 (-) Transcript_10387:1235-2011(-)